jgi:hypothetical protein
MPPRTPPAKGPNLVPVFVAIVVVIGAALAVAVMQNQQDAAQGAGSTEPDPVVDDTNRPNPFADIDNDPRGTASTRPALVDAAPAGLMDQAVFTRAKSIADEGMALVAEATAAREAGDEETYRTKGAVAKAKLETALEQTTDWILQLQDDYPNDRQVARITRETAKWDKALRKVRMIR